MKSSGGFHIKKTADEYRVAIKKLGLWNDFSELVGDLPVRAKMGETAPVLYKKALDDFREEHPEIDEYLNHSPEDAETVDDARKAYFWVWNNLEKNDVQECDAPNSGAWSTYTNAVLSNESKAEFLKIMHKFLPNQSTTNTEARYSTSGKADTKLIDETLEILRRVEIEE